MLYPMRRTIMERKESNSELLEMLTQPTFIVKSGVVELSNSAAEKYFIQSGLRPENREIFSNPQSSSFSMKILRFSSSLSKILF